MSFARKALLMMARAFSGLAIGNVLVVVAAGAFGWFKPDALPDRHVLLAVFGLLISAFVQVLTFTYFTVTGKIVLQAVHLAGHNAHAAEQVSQIKRSMSYRLLTLVAGIVVMTVSGAIHWRTGGATTIHVLSATGFLPLLCVVLTGEYGLIIKNRAVLDDATRTYEAWRREQSKRSVKANV